MSRRSELRRREALKVLGCAACAVAVSAQGCTFSELYTDFQGEAVDVDLADEAFSALQSVDGMVALDVGPDWELMVKAKRKAIRPANFFEQFRSAPSVLFRIICNQRRESAREFFSLREAFSPQRGIQYRCRQWSDYEFKACPELIELLHAKA